MKLNHKACVAAKPQDKPYRKPDGDGLHLLIKPNGKKYWVFRYSFAKKENVLSIGPFPEVSLEEARQKRVELRKMVRDGIDPSQERKQKRLDIIENAQTTFELVAREWHEHKKSGWSENYASDVIHRLEMDIFPKIGTRPIRDITPMELMKTLQKIEERGAHEMARRSLQYCGQIFRHAVVTGRAETDISVNLKGQLKPFKKSHYASIDLNKLPELVRAIDRNDARLYPHTRLGIKLMMLTFVRTSELIKATWDEIDFESKQWIIKGERMKMRRDHIVPLSRQSIEILEELKMLAGNRLWVFPSVIDPRRHMSNNTILKALERMGYKGEMTGHGFRALAMSAIKEKLGYRHEVPDRQLAHAPKSKVDAAYDRAQFLDERTKMMQEWADYLDTIAQGGTVLIGNFGKIA